MAGPGAGAFEPGWPSEGSLGLTSGFLPPAPSPDSLRYPDGQVLSLSGCHMAEGRRCWIVLLISRMVGIPLQRPEIHQLQMPTHLHPRSPRIPSSVAAFLPRTRALGLDSIDGTRWALSRAPSATLPGMRHRTRCGQILPHCGGPASPSRPRLLICHTHSL